MKKIVSAKKVALGLSGGVDSSLSAALLVEQGYDVTAVFLECWRAPGCRTDQDRKDALAVALQLKIPFQVLDFKDAYKQKVVEYFFREYEAGRTPNPDVVCNKEIKFGLFYDWAMKEGFDFVATGHYAQVIKRDSIMLLPKSSSESLDKTSSQFLVTSADAHKDQTYFLYQLTPSQLEHVLFPIGHLTKTQVRTEATRRGLPTAAKKDSVGICFIGDINVHHFLKERLGEKPGEVVDTKGRMIGEHSGLWFYTVGQRHGFTIFPKVLTHELAQEKDATAKDSVTVDKHNIPPFYVIRKNPTKNQLVVGFGPETYTDTFAVREVHWLLEPKWAGDEGENQHENRQEQQRGEQKKQSHHNKPFINNLFVRIRHTGQLFPCTLTPSNSAANLLAKGASPATLTVSLATPIQGIATGQSAVFYLPINLSQNSAQPTAAQPLFLCIGGGVISNE